MFSQMAALAAEVKSASAERRSQRRYGLKLELFWKLVRRKRVIESGRGTTVDMSSSGICFDAGRGLPGTGNVELSITWPVLLPDGAPMQLRVTGCIVRVNGTHTVIRMIQHGFRYGSARRALLDYSMRLNAPCESSQIPQ